MATRLHDATSTLEAKLDQRLDEAQAALQESARMDLLEMWALSDFYKIVSRSLESGRLQTTLCDAVVKRPLTGGIDDADTVKRHRAGAGDAVVAPWRIGREGRKHVVAGVLMA